MPPLISAHRGSCGVAGIGLAESYDRAVRIGADFVEFDLRRTGDGVYVVHHDPRLEGGRLISELTLREFRRAAGDQALTVAGLLEVVGGRVGLHADLKEAGDEEAALDLLLRRSEPKRLVVTTGVDSSVRRLKAHCPELKVGLSLGREMDGRPPWEVARVRLAELFPERRVRACRPDFLAVNDQLARATVLSYCARRSLPAWVWTVDEEAEMTVLLADPRMSVLITNRPDLAVAIRNNGEVAADRLGRRSGDGGR